MEPENYLIKLRHQIVQYFNNSELQNLCDNIGIDYEDLVGSRFTKTELAKNLIGYLARRNRLHELIVICQKERPNVVWLEEKAKIQPAISIFEPKQLIINMSNKHVFISYCHDNQDEVEELRNDLIKAGENVWWDQDILPGQDWKFEIQQAIKNSYAFILCLSKESEARSKTGIYPEALEAIARFREYKPGSIFLIPVRLSDCNIPPLEIDSTRTLDRIQYIDLFPTSRRDTGVKKLIRAIQSVSNHP
jgi:hypothetical protein